MLKQLSPPVNLVNNGGRFFFSNGDIPPSPLHLPTSESSEMYVFYIYKWFFFFYGEWASQTAKLCFSCFLCEFIFPCTFGYQVLPVQEERESGAKGAGTICWLVPTSVICECHHSCSSPLMISSLLFIALLFSWWCGESCVVVVGVLSCCVPLLVLSHTGCLQSHISI